jgi:PAS domain S-box-containing protein
MRAAWKPLSIVGALMLLLTYLLFESKTPDLALRARIHEMLQTFELHEAELARDVLLARAGLLSNYDTLARTQQALRQDLEALGRESAAASEPAARALLARHTRALVEATGTKLQLVDYFKSDNALLRNSLMYLTHAQAVLRAKVDKDRSVAEEMGHLSHLLLSFMQISDVNVGHEIQSVLDRIVTTTASDPAFPVLVKHGRFIVNILPQVDALLRQITATPLDNQARALQDAVWQYTGRVETRAHWSRLLLYLVAVTLLGYLIHQFLKLRAVASQLRSANVDLVRGVTERQTAEAALRGSEERLRAITESAKEAIVTTDSAGSIVSWNVGAATIFGYQAHEMLGTVFTRLLPQRHHASHHRAFAEWVANGDASLLQGTVEFPGVRRDSGEFPLEVSLSSWSAQNERHVTAIMRDITERKRLEETTRQQELQLIQANKMTALGTLVSGVAHEINNPNQLVLLNSRVLAEAWEDALGILDDYQDRNGPFVLGGLPYAEMRPSIPTLARDIHDGALRIDRIVDDLKNFSRPRPFGGHATFQVNDAVQRGSRLLAHVISRRTARFELKLAANLPLLRGDAQQVEQVIVNLLLNALEALPHPEKAVFVSTDLDSERRCVVLSVLDEGVGIAREHLVRLCDPFFTTKQASGGTGLGLAITASLVRAHGARLTFRSEVGRGTEARVDFPVVETEPIVAATLTL